MPRYIGQPSDDPGHCAPIAILNAEKWAGAKSTKKRLPHLIRACRSCTKRAGTDHSDFDRVIRRNPYFSVRRMYKPNILKLRKCLLNGCGAFYSYLQSRDNHDSGHLTFLPGAFQESYRGWFITNTCYASHIRISHELFREEFWYVSPHDDRTIWLVWPK